MNRHLQADKTGPVLIETGDGHKHYKKIRAVDGVSLAIPPGCCFGLLGPNGAGKTTLIEIIEDIIAPTSGSVFYKGRKRAAQFRQEVGIMFQQTALLSFLTVAETLETFSRLYDQTDDVDELIRLCHLDEVRNQPNDKISGGQKQRLLLAMALLNRPELIFLDEPSTGLDPQARRNLWDIIRQVKSKGKTIQPVHLPMELRKENIDRLSRGPSPRLDSKTVKEALIRSGGNKARAARYLGVGRATLYRFLKNFPDSA